MADPLLVVGRHLLQAAGVRPVRRRVLALVVPCHADPVAQALKRNSQLGSVGRVFPRGPALANARRSVATEMANAPIGIRLMAGPRV